MRRRRVRARRRAFYMSGAAACLLLLFGWACSSSFLGSSAEVDTYNTLQLAFPEKGGKKAWLTLDGGEMIDLARRQGKLQQRYRTRTVNIWCMHLAIVILLPKKMCGIR